MNKGAIALNSWAVINTFAPIPTLKALAHQWVTELVMPVLIERHSPPHATIVNLPEKNIW
jgi:hypothetical protein